MLCYVVLCCVVLCYVMLCYVTLCYTCPPRRWTRAAGPSLATSWMRKSQCVLYDFIMYCTILLLVIHIYIHTYVHIYVYIYIYIYTYDISLPDVYQLRTRCMKLIGGWGLRPAPDRDSRFSSHQETGGFPEASTKGRRSGSRDFQTRGFTGKRNRRAAGPSKALGCGGRPARV